MASIKIKFRYSTISDHEVAINRYIMLSAMSNLKRFFQVDTGETGYGNAAFEELHYLGFSPKD